MVTGVVALVAAAHDAERRGDGALTHGQDRAHHQQLCLLPGRGREQHGEGSEDRYNGVGQGEHGWAFSGISVKPAYPVLLLFQKMRKATLCPGAGRTEETN